MKKRTIFLFTALKHWAILNIWHVFFRSPYCHLLAFTSDKHSHLIRERIFVLFQFWLALFHYFLFVITNMKLSDFYFFLFISFCTRHKKALSLITDKNWLSFLFSTWNLFLIQLQMSTESNEIWKNGSLSTSWLSYWVEFRFLRL